MFRTLDEIAADERLADATASGEEGHHHDLDRGRVAVVDRLQQRPLLERAGHRVDVGEVLQPVRDVDGPDSHAQRRIGRQGEPGSRVDRDERSVLPPERDVDARSQRRADARVGGDDRREPRPLHGA